MKEQSKVIISIILGVAAGTVLGMLLAPEKGEDSRKKISSLANDLLDSATGLAKQVTKGQQEHLSDDNPETTLGV